MNFFLFHVDVARSAANYCDKHCIKIILEILQLLFSAVSIAEFQGEKMPLDDPFLRKYGVTKTYRVTHRNHPCAIAVRRRKRVFTYVAELGLALCREYTYRYGRTHACEPGIRALLERGLKISTLDAFKKETITTVFKTKHGALRVPLCMPTDCIVYRKSGIPSARKSHRRYFIREKLGMGVGAWKGRKTPAWIKKAQ